MTRVITLTTDFGLRDPFVGIMKGVILSICPSARLVDLTHDLPPQDVQGGGLALEAAVGFFPAGTVHLGVVDPGVGSARRAIAVRSADHYLVGPDNGLFTFAFEGAGWTAVALTAPEYRLPDVSRTFHGRDVFAPTAAYLAAGVPLERLGPRVEDPMRLPRPACRLEGRALIGEVLDSDRFGNLMPMPKPPTGSRRPSSVRRAGWRSSSTAGVLAAGWASAAGPRSASCGPGELGVRRCRRPCSSWKRGPRCSPC